MQAHDSVAIQEMAEESVTQYLGETVKLVRLQKAPDTPLVSGLKPFGGGRKNRNRHFAVMLS